MSGMCDAIQFNLPNQSDSIQFHWNICYIRSKLIRFDSMFESIFDSN